MSRRRFRREEIEDLYLPTPVQRGILFHTELDAGSAVYREQVGYGLRGALDAGAFRRAWQSAVDRHAVLRTAFVSGGGLEETHQLVLVEAEAPWAYEDLGDLPEAAREARHAELANAHLTEPFDLEQPPLLRLLLTRTGSNEHRFVMTFHHVLMDGWGVALLLRDVIAFYGAYSRGEELELDPAPRFRDFIAWLSRQDVAEAEGYWREALAGYEAPQSLGIDRQLPPDEATGAYGADEAELSELSTEALVDVARQRGLTLNTVVQGAWAIALSRYGSTRDVVFGSTLAGRPPEVAGADAMVGLFVNTVPTRVTVPGDAELIPWLEELQRGQITQKRFEYTPLADIQGWSEVPRGRPLFETTFTFENYPSVGGGDGGVALEVERESYRSRSNYPLTVLVEPGPRLRLMLGFDADRFDEHDARLFLAHFRILLEQIAADPERRIGDIPFLTPEEELEQARWNETEADYPTDRCLHDHIEAQAHATPDAIAVVAGGEQISYAALNERANQLARYLRTRGAGPDRTVGVCMDRSIEMVLAQLAAIKAGGAYLPLDPEHPDERLRYCLDDARPVVVLTQRQHRDRVAGLGVPTLALDAEWDEEIAPFAGSDLGAGTPDAAAYVIYTSGSTGRPKGVVNEHIGICNRLLWMQEEYGLSGEDRVLQKTPSTFDVSVWEFFWPLMTGSTIVMAEPGGHREPAYLLDVLARECISTLHFVPSMLQAFVAHAGASPYLPALSRVVCSGEALPADLRDRFLAAFDSVGLHNLYGPTEAAIDVTATPCHVGDPPSSVPIGWPVANTQIHLLDPDGRRGPVGVSGELYIGGAQVARAYLRRPGLTAERFVPDPFSPTGGARLYRTGDLARYLRDGAIDFLGRIDHQIKIRGFRIELGEIEAAVAAHGAVREAVVTVHDGAAGPRLIAYVAPERSPAEADDSEPGLATELRSSLERSLPSYMVPASFVFLEALPLTPNGKVDRKALPAPDDTAEPSEHGYAAPRDPREELLVGIWERVLGRESIGVHDDFFALGGHSLLATQVVTRIRDVLGVDVPLRELFDAPTVALLSERIDALADDDTPSRPGTITLADRTASLPLSFAQERLWFIDRLEPDSAAYNLPLAVRRPGSLEPAALRQALGEVARRHESLRTVFADREGRAVQVIRDDGGMPLREVDLSGVPHEDRMAEVRRLAGADAARPFDLEVGPLVRGAIVRLAGADHVLVLTMHHAVSDGWSQGVLIRELSALYPELARGAPSPLSELARQYADFAAWQRAWLSGETLERQLGYWGERLAGAPHALELLTDRPRPPAQSYAGAAERFTLGPALSRQVAELSRREGVTVFMTLMTALQTLLHRWSGQDTVVVGTPIAGRTHAETEGLIGFFVNTLALRGDFHGDPTFVKLLARTRTAALEAYAHQDVPFEKLLAHLDVERDLSRPPLFQVMFVLQNATAESIAFEEGTLEPIEADHATAKFDLTLDLTEGPDELAGALEYNTDLFDRDTAKRFVDAFTALLEVAVDAPERRVSQLPAGEPAGVAPAAGPFEQEMPLHLWFDEAASRAPDAVALVHGDEQVTYGELAVRANRLAHALRARGVAPESLVGLCVERSVEMVVGILGTLKAGGAYVPLDPAHPPERLRHVIDDAGLAVILTHSTLRDRLPPTSGLVIAMDEEGPGRDVPPTPPAVTVLPDNVAYVIYTSGSTGRPKGTPVTHRNVRRLFSATDGWFDFGDGEVWTLFHSYGFDFSVWELWGALAYGGRLVVVPFPVSRAPESFHRLLCDERVTVLNQTPSAFQQLSAADAAAGSGPEARTALRYVVFGGEALTLTELAGWFERHGDRAPRLVNMYGITETTVHVTYRPIAAADLDASVADSPIGVPIPDLQVRVRDRYGNEVPVGVAGEMYVGGPGVARGYLGRPDLTAERFVPDPHGEGSRLYRSGDGARVFGDGQLGFLGRIDQQVKIRGFRIELGEIESVLSEHPALASAVVVARDDGSAQRLVAYTVPSGVEAPTVGALRAHLGAKLPDYMIPSAFVSLDELPLTPNGKVDRRALPAPDQARPELEGDYVEPRSVGESALAEIWAEVLGVDRVGVHDNFFELGGDSILSLLIVSKARQAGLEISAKHVFQNQTVASLAAAAGTMPSVVAEQGAVVGPAPLTPIQRWFLDSDPIDPEHFNQAVLLSVPADIDIERVRRAGIALLAHHDVLRARFVRDASGAWRQEIAAPRDDFAVDEVDLSEETAESHEAALDAAVTELHRRVDLGRGPMMRIGRIRLGTDRDRLLVVVHHLAVDGVSWRILLEDLLAAYEQLGEGRTPELPAKTTSYRLWATRLAEGAVDAAADEVGFWTSAERASVDRLPRDHGDGENLVSGQETVSMALTEEETRALLTGLPERYGTRVDDALLTALAVAIADWSRSDRVLVDMEGHGRESPFDDVDLSRTVGWFTSIYPVLLDIDHSAPIANTLRAVQRRLEGVPERGVGYGRLRYGDPSSEVAQRLAAMPGAEVSFNYLGQFDQVLPADTPFGWAEESSGPPRSPRAERTHLLEVGGMVTSGRLRLTIQYSRDLHTRDTVDRLAAATADALRALVEAASAPAGEQLTASDFPLVTVRDRLEQVLDSAPDIVDLYPASPTQQGLLFHTLYAPESGVYFTQLACVIEGPLDRSAFERAWQTVIDRHAILRTSFRLQGLEQPLQVVHRDVPPSVHFEDWRSIPDAALDARLHAFARDQRHATLRVDRAPLMRLALLRTGEERYQLVWGHHHALLDGWSMAIVLTEVLELYDGYSAGAEVELPTPVPYRDYIAWQGRRGLDAAESFWRERLADFVAPNRLALDAPRDGDSGDGEHEVIRRALPASATDALLQFGRGNQLTLNTLVQGGWALMLAAYSRRSDVVFGETVSGRPPDVPGVDRMVGLFINTIPVRALVEPRRPLVEWLAELQLRQSEVRDFEFAPLVQIRAWSEVPIGTPLFESLLVFENYPIDEALAEGSAEVRVTAVDTVETTNYPLTLVAAPGPELGVRAIFDPAVLDAGRVEQLLDRFLLLLEALPSVGDHAVEELPRPSPEEVAAVEQWNATRRSHEPELVAEALARQARERPDAVAVVFGSEQLTYSTLNARANQLARHLRGLGVGPEVVVGVSLDRSAEMVVALAAIVKAGGAYLPLDPTYPKERLSYMLADSGAAVLVATESTMGGLEVTDQQVVHLDRDAAAIHAAASTELPLASPPETLAYVIYTSGSTGRPKGVGVRHVGLSNLVAWHRDAYRVDPKDRATMVAALSFDASVWELWPYVTSGATVHVADEPTRLSVPDLVGWLERERITVAFLPTPLTEAALGMPGIDRLALRSLLTGGDKLQRAPRLDLGFELVNNYGPTENTVVATSGVVEAGSAGTPPIGRPIDNTEAWVVGDSGQRTPPGLPGELYVGGVQLARGYLGRPALTAERFVPSGWAQDPGARLYRTGDLTRHRPDGALDFLGRVDHQVKVRGFRIELGEIEAALNGLPSVSEAVVVARYDVGDQARLVAYVLPASSPEPAAAELRSALREELPDYMVPAAFVTLERFPMTRGGKIDRAALPEPDQARPDVGADYVAPAGRHERAIAEIWAEVLGVTDVGVRDNFFELGGNSLLLLNVHGKINERLGREVPIVELFEYPTVSALARHLAGEGGASEPLRAEVRTRAGREGASDALAVIGMSGRFPDADDLEAFWANLRDGVESVRFFTDEELREAGVDEALIADPRYVPARGVLENVGDFDADFFGFTPREAEITDPQHRLFLECAYQALELAGYDPARYPGLIGVYAGSSMNSYLFNLISNPGLIETIPRMQLLGGNDKDFVPTKVSYKLNLRGPSLTVQTACSTSLVAFHEACQSLLANECDIALAGGVSVSVPLVTGYLYQEDGIFSPDGHCRAFDAKGQGTISGHGVGVVVLKRLDEAIADGDVIHAVVRGTAINNDGSAKVGYTAPSVEGQAQVIALAHAAAGVEPSEISYIEAHGTATALGDPIEVAALTRVFEDPERPRESCGIGGVKTNVGHLDAAAGVTGVIKTVLALKHGQIPPSLHFESPNPKIDFEAGPFYVNAELRDWETRDGAPRMAGVSSFGIGGTNAHAVLQEAPAVEPSDPAGLARAFLLSAKSPRALDDAVTRLADHLERHPDQNLDDVAYTLRVGRGQFEHRAAVVGRTHAEVVAALRERAPDSYWTGRAPAARPPVVFLFPGGGAQHVHMGLGLYRDEPRYREIIDECAVWLREHRDFDLAEFLCTDVSDDEAARARLTERLTRTDLAQPSMFAMELAMARLWISRGVEPAACLGHSTGEYVAACLGGVMSLEDALAAVTLRSRSMDQARPGLMLAVPLPPADVEGLLGDGLWLGAVNGPEASVLSGTPERIREVKARLTAEDVECRLLPHTNHAYHTPMMSEVIDPFVRSMKEVDLRPPSIPFVSNVTGRFITEEEATDPSYWGRQTSTTVRFADGVSELRRLGEDVVFLEVGPGTTLSSLVRRQLPVEARGRVFASLRHARDDTPDDHAMEQALGRLWLTGVEPDWDAYYARERRLRVELPTYPFQRKRYWVEARPFGAAPGREALRKRPNVAEWFYLPGWRTSAPPPVELPQSGEPRDLLLLQDGTGFGAELAERLRATGRRVTTVQPAESFGSSGEASYTVAPSDPAGFDPLLAALRDREMLPDEIVVAWPLDALDGGGDGRVERALGLEALLHVTQALHRAGVTDPVSLTVLTVDAHSVTGVEELRPMQGAVIGLAKVVPQEYANLSCRCVDLSARDLERPSLLVRALLPELVGRADAESVALRNQMRFVQSYDRVPLRAGAGADVIRDGAVVLVTGGLGQVGLALAEHLARAARARLALLGRSDFPRPEAWDAWLAENGPDDATSVRIRRLRAIEESGGKVLVVRADVADTEALEAAIHCAESELGPLSGVIHAAADTGPDTLRSIEELTVADLDRQHRPKVEGLLTLDRLLGERSLDFRMVTSSLSALLGGLRYAAYASANAFLDAYSGLRGADGRPRWQSINSDGWFFPDSDGLPGGTDHMVMTPPEGVDALTRAMSLVEAPRVVVSSGPLQARLDRAAGATLDEETTAEGPRHERPELEQPYVAPSNEIEQTIADNCGLLLGIDRVGVNDNFFELGGDSLIATQLMSRLRAAFQIDLSLEALFSARTIADLATVVLEELVLQDEELTEELLAEVEELEAGD